MDQGHAQADHSAAHHQRPKDPPEQYAVLVMSLHREVFEQQHKNEQIVHAERFFNQVAGEEFQRRSPAVPVQQAEVEPERHHHPDHAPGPRLADRDDVRPAMEYTEVQRQHEQHEDVESDPEPERAHGSSVVLRGKKKKSGGSRAAQTEPYFWKG